MDPFVVVGGDAAGLSAASKLKREAPDREVVVFEKGRWVSYAHCGTPYYVKGEVDSLTDLVSLSPDEVAERDIDLRREHEVVAVDPEDRVVVAEGPAGRVEQPYGDVLLGTGARARSDPIEGADLFGAFTLHGLPDATAIRAFVDDGFDPETAALGPMSPDEFRRHADADPPETAAVIGGGYVGVEMAEALAAHGIDVHVLQRGSHLLGGFGAAVGEAVADELAAQGVTVHTDTAVEAIEGEGRVERVAFEGGALDAGAAIVGVGIAPNTALAEDAGADLGPSGAVAVDRYGRTSVEGVYAAGDCAESRHVVSGEATWVPLGLTANRAGRAIGATLGGDPTPVGGVAGTAVVKAFDLGAGRTGFVSESAAREAGFDPVSETITAGSRSGYYPGAEETTVTLTADRGTGRVLGASVVGRDRAAKRIDTVATALGSDTTVAEMERLDLAYAPPFSPVWDPILVAAKVLRDRV
ncbi:FAD-dependent oxidoreductase [Halosegnis marinus]|uniref:FAD-dependent oxidoreductase n=1 Tax=Halosegnis marinus TaxID=3034023 RepID=A0ABD5ZMG6_9EURY|nr:FAD-dependent oxidoreductase [Halosegnis sp. DT85]